MTAAYLIHYPPMMPVVVHRFADTEAAMAEFERQPVTFKERAKVVWEADHLREMGGPVLVQVYNKMMDKPIKRFENLDAGVTRTWDAIEAFYSNQAAVAELQQDAAAETDELPEPEENKNVATKTTKKNGSAEPKTKKPRGTKMLEGKPAGRVSDFKQIRPGTDRAKVLEWMDGEHTTAAIAKRIDDVEAKVLAHAYCLARDCAIGYKLTEAGKLLAIYPGSKTFADALKEPVEPKPRKKKNSEKGAVAAG